MDPDVALADLLESVNQLKKFVYDARSPAGVDECAVVIAKLENISDQALTLSVWLAQAGFMPSYPPNV